jgi:hypothetical protein
MEVNRPDTMIKTGILESQRPGLKFRLCIYEPFVTGQVTFTSSLLCASVSSSVK